MNLSEAMQVADNPVRTPRAELVLALVQLVQKVRSDESHLLEAERVSVCGRPSSHAHLAGGS